MATRNDKQLMLLGGMALAAIVALVLGVQLWQLAGACALFNLTHFAWTALKGRSARFATDRQWRFHLGASALFAAATLGMFISVQPVIELSFMAGNVLPVLWCAAFFVAMSFNRKAAHGQGPGQSRLGIGAGTSDR